MVLKKRNNWTYFLLSVRKFIRSHIAQKVPGHWDI